MKIDYKTLIISLTTIITVILIIIMTTSWNINNKISEKNSEFSKLLKIKEETKIETETETEPNNKEIEKKENIIKITNIENSTQFLEELEKLKELKEWTYKKISITKEDNGILNKISSRDLIYYFLDYKWKIGDSWYIKDIKKRKYYVPEGIIKINAGTEFEWKPYTGNDVVNIILIYKVSF